MKIHHILHGESATLAANIAQHLTDAGVKFSTVRYDASPIWDKLEETYDEHAMPSSTEWTLYVEGDTEHITDADVLVVLYNEADAT